MSNAIAVQHNGNESIMERVIAKGDLAKLSSEERAMYYVETCRSLGINELTKPFDYITLNGKLTLYATRTATDQLRKIHGISLTISSEETTPDGLRVVRVRATDPKGRSDEEIGAVNVAGLKGDALSNAYMKAITKAKRRATLSICGLGWMDESEVESVPAARPVNPDESRSSVSAYVPDDLPVVEVDGETGEIFEPVPAELIESWARDLREAPDTTALEELGRQLSQAALDDEARAKLAAVYKQRKAQLRPQAQPELIDVEPVTNGEPGNDRFTN